MQGRGPLEHRNFGTAFTASDHRPSLSREATEDNHNERQARRSDEYESSYGGRIHLQMFIDIMKVLGFVTKKQARV
jgi:hypothetical protein